LPITLLSPILQVEDPQVEDEEKQEPIPEPEENKDINFDGYNEQSVRERYLYTDRYKYVDDEDIEIIRAKAKSLVGQPKEPDITNKITELSSYIDIYYRNDRHRQNTLNDDKDMINKIKMFENNPRNPLETLELRFGDRLMFIIVTFFIRYVTISIIQRGIDINLIPSFYEAFIYYGCIYIIFFWFIVFFVNIENNYTVDYLNINGIMTYIRSLFYYFYMGTNGISRLLIHSFIIILIIIIPIILNIKNKVVEDPINDEQLDKKPLLTLEERTRLSKLLSTFTLFIWILTSIIATKF